MADFSAIFDDALYRRHTGDNQPPADAQSPAEYDLWKAAKAVAEKQAAGKAMDYNLILDANTLMHQIAAYRIKEAGK